MRFSERRRRYDYKGQEREAVEYKNNDESAKNKVVEVGGFR